MYVATEPVAPLITQLRAPTTYNLQLTTYNLQLTTYIPCPLPPAPCTLF